MQYFVEAGAIAVRRVTKEDMRHVAKATGATQVYKFFLLFDWLLCNVYSPCCLPALQLFVLTGIA